jgi:nitric oxide reductase NorE protein
MGWRKVVMVDRRVSRGSGHHIPGEPGLWVMFMGDLIIFSVFFTTFLNYRNATPSLFHASAMTLNRGFGLTNTILLLTSSLFAAIAVQWYRDGHARAAFYLLVASAALGWGFVAVKIMEYAEKLQTGIQPDTNIFFTLYFVLTGIHLLHVLIGEAVLLAVILKTNDKDTDSLSFVEGGVCFWHIVDLLWIIIFSLFYMSK